jgi:hypothetical protein
VLPQQSERVLDASCLQVFQEYSKICKYDIRESIKREMGGNLKRGLQTIVDVIRDPLGMSTTVTSGGYVIVA